jgi:hypothetical protein
MDRVARMKLPAWFRIVLVASAVILVAGAGFLSYRWYIRPTTLTIAVGSLDGEAHLRAGKPACCDERACAPDRQGCTRHA